MCDFQAYWVYSALTAMEYGFDTLPGGPAWDVIAANAFNLFVERWGVASETCNGGLKWQYHPGPSGWTVSLPFLLFPIFPYHLG